MSWDDNITSHPEQHGLTLVLEDEQGVSYEFDTLLLFRHTDGSFYAASDSGCSCPVPFENFTELADLTRVETADQFLAVGYRDSLDLYKRAKEIIGR